MDAGNLRGQLAFPKTTNNAALAIVLFTCGVPFTTHEGVIYPGFNFYSDALLKERGYEGKSRTVAIAELWNRGIPGQIVYQFERQDGDTLLNELCEGWDDHEERIKKAKESPTESQDRPYAATPTFREGLPSAAAVAAIARQLMETEEFFFGKPAKHGKPGRAPLWKLRDKRGRPFVPPMKSIEGASRTENEPDGRRTVYGSINLQEVKV